MSFEAGDIASVAVPLLVAAVDEELGDDGLGAIDEDDALEPLGAMLDDDELGVEDEPVGAEDELLVVAGGVAGIAGGAIVVLDELLDAGGVAAGASTFC